MVHVVWQGGGTARIRSLTGAPSGYVWGPVRDTGTPSKGADVGPAIQADANGVRIVTPSGAFAIPNDGGETWKTEAVPMSLRQAMKGAALRCGPVRRRDHRLHWYRARPEGHLRGRGIGGYWQLHTILREPDGSWADARDALSVFPNWGKPSGKNDVPAACVRIGTDIAGGPARATVPLRAEFD